MNVCIDLHIRLIKLKVSKHSISLCYSISQGGGSILNSSTVGRIWTSYKLVMMTFVHCCWKLLVEMLLSIFNLLIFRNTNIKGSLSTDIIETWSQLCLYTKLHKCLHTCPICCFYFYDRLRAPLYGHYRGHSPQSSATVVNKSRALNTCDVVTT